MEELFRYHYNGKKYRNKKYLCLVGGISKRKFSAPVKMGHIKKLDNQSNIVSGHGNKGS